MTDPKKTIHMIGHGHIDPTWLWRWTEGYEEVHATFRSALERMKETPSFKFIASSACFYAWVKDCEPEMFDEIRRRVREGRWEIVGGWWVEPDCNIPCGESFVRQGLYSQRFFEREFGVRAKVGFNADSFGHAGTLPQIYKKSGIDYYVFHRPCPGVEMDYPEGTTFWWEAKDGTRVLASNILIGYGAHERDIQDRLERLPKNLYQNPDQKHLMGFYGVGNHGGGPTKVAIAKLLEAQKSKNGPAVRLSTLSDYFEGFLQSTDEDSIPTLTTDLQHHARGCYSAHSEIKRLNRSAEHALMTAERFATVVWTLFGRDYPQERLEAAWKHVLCNQFHDILAGTSIESSYEDSRDQLGAARNTACEVLNESIQSLGRNINTSTEGNTIVVFNPLTWPVKQVVKAPPIVTRCLDLPVHLVNEREQPVPLQGVIGERIDHTAWAFTAEVPALGYCCYHCRSGEKKVKSPNQLKGDRCYLENDWWRIEFDPYQGHIARLFDKTARVEVLRKGNVLAALADSSDTWGHGYDEWISEVGRFGNARLELFELGEVLATVRVASSFRNSQAERFVTLYRHVDTIDCVIRVNWQERYTMLKLAYETNVKEGKATSDTAYGVQERQTFGKEEPGQMWFDLTGKVGRKAYGLALLNDSKYGFDVSEKGQMRLTLLRSPAYAHHSRGRYDGSSHWPIMDQGWQTIRVRLVPHVGSWQRAGVVRAAWELNEPAFTHIESGHDGKFPPKLSFLESTSANVALIVLKQSEDGKDLVVRGYETEGREAKNRIRLPGVKEKVEARFGPHEIKTLRIDRETGVTSEVNLLEESETEGM